MSLPKKTKKPPTALPATRFDNPQLHLFQTFLANTDGEREDLSNAIDLWDSVPRYCGARSMAARERVNGRLGNHKAVFHYRGMNCTGTIRPGSYDDPDGVKRDYFPGVTEEILEDALRKLAIEQNAGFFDQPNLQSGVVFTLHQLRNELKERGHTRSYQEIVKALYVLLRSTIQIEADSNGVISQESGYISGLTVVSRNKLKEDPQSRWQLRFHPLVTESINRLTYRQFNYAKLMSLKSQLARWLLKYLVLKYTFASIVHPFEIRFTTIKRDSGLLDGYKVKRQAVQAAREAFDELTQEGVLLSVKTDTVLGPRAKVLDVVFTLTPSLDFVREAKAANKRRDDAKQLASAGIVEKPGQESNRY